MIAIVQLIKIEPGPKRMQDGNFSLHYSRYIFLDCLHRKNVCQFFAKKSIEEKKFKVICESNETIRTYFKSPTSSDQSQPAAPTSCVGAGCMDHSGGSFGDCTRRFLGLPE